MRARTRSYGDTCKLINTTSSAGSEMVFKRAGSSSLMDLFISTASVSWKITKNVVYD